MDEERRPDICFYAGTQIRISVKTVSPVRAHSHVSGQTNPGHGRDTEEPHELKEPGETYDDLLKSLAQDRRRKELADRFREMDESRDYFVALEEV